MQIADDLEHRGLLERRRLSTDRRTQVLHPHDSLPAVLEEAGRLADAMTASLLTALSEQQTERLVNLLQRLVTAP